MLTPAPDHARASDSPPSASAESHCSTRSSSTPTSDTQEVAEKRNCVRANLASPAWGGWSVCVGVIACVLCAVLARGALTQSGLSSHDVTVMQWMVAHRHPWVTSTAWMLTTLADVVGLTLLTVITALLLLARRARRRAAVLVLVMAGSALVTTALKVLVGRPRPSDEYVAGTPLTSFSFPSGHSLNSAVFLGLLAAYAVLFLRRRWAVPAVIGTLLVTVLVGLTRIYLAYHWFTDVLGGWTVAVAWLSLVGASAHVCVVRFSRVSALDTQCRDGSDREQGRSSSTP